MKFTCSKEELDKQLQHVSRIVTVRHTLPVLSNILLETDGKIVRMSATDLELSITTHIAATVIQEGAFTVPAKIFQEFVHQNPDEEITFTLEGNELVCVSAKVQGRIAGIDPEEYPELPKTEEKQRVVLPAQGVIAAIKQVVIASATDTARPVLTGVLFQMEGQSVTMVATDSFRLVEKTIQVQGAPVTEAQTLLIPARTIQELVRITAQMPEVVDITIIIGEQQIICKVGTLDVHSRLLTGIFPKYQAIIPTTFVATVDVTATELVQALRLATIFSQAGIANVLLEIAEDGVLTIASYGSQRGSAKHTLYAVVQEGFTPIRAAFNTRFLLDAAQAPGTDYIQLKFSGTTTPLVLSTEDTNYLQLVMPIRLEN